ncbi:putative invertase inhibitor [Punica granatum]|uniref:Pectinesterase inhibitor domain-containing protein n=2 Tax=Punica granatum TaxID=22663 RepID=A0A218WRK1_PUNGR|nr:putative invertase inhibitor [Punica granatum]OWM75098.1 hypothetical protein CDL15_Pgr017224 [Punica granatum]PKI67809.1 hypothetical protein CRG98_011782 [Punica granatum]
MKLPFVPFSSLPLFLSFCLIAATGYDDFTEAPATNPLVPETCSKAAQKDPNLSYGFCVSALQSAPNSLCADTLQKLGLISIKLIWGNVTSTRCYIKYLLKNKKINPYVWSCLDDCLELYSDAVPTLKQAVQDYQAKRYDDANVEVSSLIDAATTCEDGFEEKELVSPLKKRNDNAFKLSALALSIINMLPR